MKCPFCGEEMQPGKLRTRGYNYFVPDGCKTPSLYTEKSMEKAGAIPVSPDAVGAACEANWNTAFLCPKCRKYIAKNNPLLSTKGGDYFGQQGYYCAYCDFSKSAFCVFVRL